MFSIFKRKKPDERPALNLSYDAIKVDMHSHVLPGIDDGAQTVEESLVLVKSMMDVGIKKIIATPHVMADYFRNTPESIGNALTILRERLAAEQIDMQVEAAAEHFFDELFEARIEEGKAFTMGDNYVLFELSFINKPPNAVQVIQKMKDMGYKPILAHPERYTYLSIDEFRNFHDWGCDFQLNTISLTGYYGGATQKLAEQLIDLCLYEFMSSDMHHERHAKAFKHALKLPYVEKLLTDYPIKNSMLL
jgi:tyrosine-protein phosphatase YwqE